MAVPLESQVNKLTAYLEQLVNKGVLDQLPGAVTEVMETVSQLSCLLETNLSPDQQRQVMCNKNEKT